MEVYSRLRTGTGQRRSFVQFVTGPAKEGDRRAPRNIREELVGARGFEPPTTTTPRWCATRLRYAPSVNLRDKIPHNARLICGRHHTGESP